MIDGRSEGWRWDGSCNSGGGKEKRGWKQIIHCGDPRREQQETFLMKNHMFSCQIDFKNSAWLFNVHSEWHGSRCPSKWKKLIQITIFCIIVCSFRLSHIVSDSTTNSSLKILWRSTSSALIYCPRCDFLVSCFDFVHCGLFHIIKTKFDIFWHTWLHNKAN